ELKELGKEWGRIEDFCKITDTLVMARTLHPGQKNNLNALCGRYDIDNSQRDLHGALLDAQILLDVYLAMTGGQTSLSLYEEKKDDLEMKINFRLDKNRTRLKTIKPDNDELVAHEQRLASLNQVSDGNCVWLKIEAED
ncbi:MAG: DNA polymerase-3 subunit epsilon, partial [Gammaproteobacteria bacterium]